MYAHHAGWLVRGSVLRSFSTQTTPHHKVKSTLNTPETTDPIPKPSVNERLIDPQPHEDYTSYEHILPTPIGKCAHPQNHPGAGSTQVHRALTALRTRRSERRTAGRAPPRWRASPRRCAASLPSSARRHRRGCSRGWVTL